MINCQRLVQLARKWRKLAAIGRRRISLPRTNSATNLRKCNIASTAKGHFVVYTTDGRRFMIPLEYLNSSIFTELLNIAEDEYGLPSDGPIMLPCDAIFMDYVVSLVRRRLSKDVGMALLTSTSTRCSTSSVHQHRQTNQLLSIYGF